MGNMAVDGGGISTLVLKTGEPKPIGFTGLMVDRFKPANKLNRSAGLVPKT
jgi:hypothetical protein